MKNQFEEKLKYTRNGDWIHIDGNTLVWGISECSDLVNAECTFISIDYEVGDEIEAGKPMGVLESLKGVAELYAPVSGKITAINDLLNTAPNLLNTDPYGDGWIVKFEVSSETDFTSFLDATEYEKWVMQVTTSRKILETKNPIRPEDLLGVIVGPRKIISIEAIGAENVVFKLQNVDTGEIDEVLALSRSMFIL